MLGLEDASIAFVWIATVLSGIGCVIFGALMWNRGGEGE
ncbi:symporter small accessory protein [Halobacillus shinanisalinarum]